MQYSNNTASSDETETQIKELSKLEIKDLLYNSLIKILPCDTEEELLKCYNPDWGCVPEDCVLWNDEDILFAIRDKFKYPYLSVCNNLYEQYQIMPKILVEPSYEDTTYVTLIYKNIVIEEYNSKAWNFSFISVEEVKDFLYETYNAIEINLIKNNLINSIKLKNTKIQPFKFIDDCWIDDDDNEHIISMIKELKGELIFNKVSGASLIIENIEQIPLNILIDNLLWWASHIDIEHICTDSYTLKDNRMSLYLPLNKLIDKLKEED